jgi:hypothetical protein
MAQQVQQMEQQIGVQQEKITQGKENHDLI